MPTTTDSLEIADTLSTRSSRAIGYFDSPDVAGRHWQTSDRAFGHDIQVEVTAVPWTAGSALPPYLAVNLSIRRFGKVARTLGSKYKSMDCFDENQTIQLLDPNELDTLIATLIAVRDEARRARTFEPTAEAV